MSVEIGTAPKYRLSKLVGAGLATNAVPARTSPQNRAGTSGRPMESRERTEPRTRPLNQRIVPHARGVARKSDHDLEEIGATGEVPAREHDRAKGIGYGKDNGRPQLGSFARLEEIEPARHAG